MALASSNRPGPGTATGRVWEIADELSRRDGSRARRAAVIDAYVKEGGNPNTAHTQFQKWRSAYEENRRRTSSSQTRVRVEVKDGGRLLLPAELRSALGIREGDKLMAEVADGELRLLPQATAIKRAQEYVQRLVPADVSLVDELITERRAEARREHGE
jgi:AbrB family looped-hinge helix DNA binding protein